eukprot:jgi/Phyca11/106824/e_gw1.12.892.1
MRCTRTPAFKISIAVVTAVQKRLESNLHDDEVKLLAHRASAFRRAGVPLPTSLTSPRTAQTQPNFFIDAPLQSGISEVVRKLRLSLIDTIRLWRGQSDEDPRPNKALRSEHLSWLLHGFPQLPLLLNMIQHGVTHHFRPVPPNKGNLTSNHKSARTWSNVLKRSVREGQDAGTPFGCVPKADADPNVEARVIHDLSYPSGNSINSSSDPGILPEL